MQCYLIIKHKWEVARLSIAGKAFLALIIMPDTLLALISDSLAPCFRCIENLKEGDEDAKDEHPHLL